MSYLTGGRSRRSRTSRRVPRPLCRCPYCTGESPKPRLELQRGSMLPVLLLAFVCWLGLIYAAPVLWRWAA